MGTARMGRDSKTSVLNAHNQIHAVPNVFVTDGSFGVVTHAESIAHLHGADGKSVGIRGGEIEGRGLIEG